MRHYRGIYALIDARNGKPNEYDAAKAIATFAVIPMAMVGLFIGLYFAGWRASEERLIWACIIGASVGGIGMLLLTWMVYRVFGFRPLVLLADILTGAFSGLFLGGAVSRSSSSWWPLLLCPLLAILVPLVAPRPPREDANAQDSNQEAPPTA